MTKNAKKELLSFILEMTLATLVTAICVIDAYDLHDKLPFKDIF
jgi:hypothetical protein